MLLEKTKEYAQQVRHTNFKASIGSLTNCKKGYDILTIYIENTTLVSHNNFSIWLKNIF